MNNEINDEEIDISDIQKWKKDRITKLYKDYIREEIEFLEKNLLEIRGFEPSSILKDYYLKGKIDGKKEIFDFDFDEIF